VQKYNYNYNYTAAYEKIQQSGFLGGIKYLGGRGNDA
jgi:hypothetical protein